MIASCRLCGSYAINPSQHPRETPEEDELCDVCLYLKRAEALRKRVEKLEGAIASALVLLEDEHPLPAMGKLELALEQGGEDASLS